MSDYIVYIEFSSASKLSAEIRINDIPQRRIDTGKQGFVAMSVNPFILPGENEVSVIIDPDPDSAKSRPDYKPGEGTWQTRIARYRGGERLGEGGGETVLELSSHLDAASYKENRITTARFNMPGYPHIWTFSKCARLPVELLEGKNDLLDFVEQLYDAFVKGNASYIISLADIYIKESAEAFPGMQEEGLRAMVSGDISENAGHVDAFAPFNRENVVITPCHYGKLVMFTDPDGQPVISTRKGADYQYELPVKLGIHEDKIKILR